MRPAEMGIPPKSDISIRAITSLEEAHMPHMYAEQLILFLGLVFRRIEASQKVFRRTLDVLAQQ